MSSLAQFRRDFEPYRDEVSDLYEAVRSGEDPGTLPGCIGQGSWSYVFEAESGMSVIKLPLVQFMSERQAHKRVRSNMAALALGYGYPRLEQAEAYNDTDLPAVICAKVIGKNLPKATAADLAGIHDGHLRGVLNTFNYMDAQGITIEDDTPSDIILNNGFTFIDYIAKKEPYSTRLAKFGWMLYGGTWPHQRGVELALMFHGICSQVFPPNVVAPLTNTLRDDAHVLP